MSRGIPPQVVTVAERCSQFSRQAGFSIDRVIYSYRTVRCPDGIWHVLTSIRDAGADYSGRTNHLAQHLVLSASEASELARQGNTPAGVMLGTVCSWGDHDGFCGWLEETPHSVSSELDASWQFWNAYTGSGYCRLNLCSDEALRGAVLIYGTGLQLEPPDAKQVLCLFAESQAGCPDKGWGITFTTTPELNDELSEFRWIGVAVESPMLGKVEATGGRVRVTFETPPPAARQPGSGITNANIRVAPQDTGSDPQEDLTLVRGGPGKSVGTLPPRIPPKRPRAVGKRESFLTSRFSKIAVVAAALVAVAAIGLLLNSLMSEVAPAFQGPLTSIYDGTSKEVTLADGRAVLYRPSWSDTDNWSHDAPKNYGSYELGIEQAAWFGLVRKIKSTGVFLNIKKAQPNILFPENLDFVTSEGSTTNWPIVPRINPPEAGAGVTVEYRGLPPDGGNWTPIAKYFAGNYEVKVSTPETVNFTSSVGITNFTITYEAPKTVPVSEKVQAEGPIDSDLTNSITSGQPPADVGPPRQDTSVAYYLALGSDALQQANKAEAWKGNPSSVEVRNWGEDEAAFRAIDEQGGLSTLSRDFTMTSNGLPKAKTSTSIIKNDALVYLASYSTDPRKIYIIGLRAKGDNEGSVRDLLPGNAWLSLNKTNSLLELNSPNAFFKSAKLLPAQSKWILVYEAPPYSEGKGALKLVSDTAAFDLRPHLKVAEDIRKAAEDQLKASAEQTSNPQSGDNYFDQNRLAIIRPIEELSNESTLTAKILEEIKKLPKPDVDKKDPSSDAKLAAALLLGALKVVYSDPDIQARIQLSKSNQNKIDRQIESAKSDKGGRDASKIQNSELLPPAELEDWLQEKQQQQKLLTIREIKTQIHNWIKWRINNLQPRDEKTSAIDDPIKKVLEKLEKGIKACSDSPSTDGSKNPLVQRGSVLKQIEVAQEKVHFFQSWGTTNASGYARLQLRLGDSEPVTLLPRLRLGPAKEAVE